jgi:hypothetical protein
LYLSSWRIWAWWRKRVFARYFERSLRDAEGSGMVEWRGMRRYSGNIGKWWRLEHQEEA